MYMICEKCKGKKYIGEIYCYTDNERDMVDMEICRDCLKKHVEKYFPGSPIDKKLSEIMEE